MIQACKEAVLLLLTYIWLLIHDLSQFAAVLMISKDPANMRACCQGNHLGLSLVMTVQW